MIFDELTNQCEEVKLERCSFTRSKTIQVGADLLCLKFGSPVRFTRICNILDDPSSIIQEKLTPLEHNATYFAAVIDRQEKHIFLSGGELKT